MNNTLKKTVLAIAVAGAMAGATSANAITGIRFDFSGTGGSGTPVDEMDGNNATVLGVNSVSGVTAVLTNTVDGTFLVGQGQVNAASFHTIGISNLALVAGFFTYQFSIPLSAKTTAGNTAGSQVIWDQGGSPDYGATNYFKMFFTAPAVADASTGTGFGDAGTGTMIMEGKVTINSSGASASISTTVTKALGTNGGTNATIPSFGMGGSVNFDIDVCQASETSGAGVTAGCDGNAVSFVSTNFFRSLITALELDIDFTDNITTGFASKPVPNSVVGDVANFGNAKNDFICGAGGVGPNSSCDVLFSGTPAAFTFNDSFVPEPGTLALLGLGLAGLGASARRRRSTQS